MSKFGVREEKGAALLARMRALNIREEDLEETFIRSSGPGGQNVNKTATCVYLKHRPTGTEVKIQRERSQALNRFLARRILADRIEEKTRGLPSEEVRIHERIRRQKHRRSRRSRKKLHGRAEKGSRPQRPEPARPPTRCAVTAGLTGSTRTARTKTIRVVRERNLTGLRYHAAKRQ